MEVPDVCILSEMQAYPLDFARDAMREITFSPTV